VAEKVAKATGELTSEVKGAKVTRKNHKGHPYETSGPATTQSQYDKMHPFKPQK
jgi:hypothetical protein